LVAEEVVVAEVVAVAVVVVLPVASPFRVAVAFVPRLPLGVVFRACSKHLEVV